MSAVVLPDTMSDLRMTTPRGSAVTLTVRDGTADHNNVWSACQEDEYGLRDVELAAGWALDVGAHIGGVTVPLAVDNPDARIIAVEAVAANVALLEANLERNGVRDRVHVFHAVAHRPGVESATVRWNFRGSESAEHHRFIGNAQRIPNRSAEVQRVRAMALSAMLAVAGGYAAFMKIDCEGGEYDLLADPDAVRKVREIRGEYHAGWDALVALLDASHGVSRTVGDDRLGGFRAVAR